VAGVSEFSAVKAADGPAANDGDFHGKRKEGWKVGMLEKERLMPTTPQRTVTARGGIPLIRHSEPQEKGTLSELRVPF